MGQRALITAASEDNSELIKTRDSRAINPVVAGDIHGTKAIHVR
jgi:hypothetical protein